ncbi:MAG: class I SAM-dependent methyltransferase [Methylomonas sp.]|jgi:predicted methyltransferase|uniref:class I SAM-dependent methyltransferase n=1 Tax=Methylomonas sp. TaxID=418 RepID=UPI0025D8508C|nr:class I SAM-dependent methyltransferase [Methylomonas sp.]MCK9606814.1 class I SAM-dependent methyltransferase [Methylomonas sp.]
MKRISFAETAHSIILEYLRKGDVAVDATVGNGHDTVFLAECVGRAGQVFGFDVQTQALRITRQRMRQQDLSAQTILFHASHADMAKRIPQEFHGSVKAIMFNLGYLPGTDKSVITKTQTTLQAIDAGCRLLAEQGVITVMAYPGHAGGDEETSRLTHWLQQLDSASYIVQTVYSQHHQAHAPRLFVIKKMN